MTCSQKTGRGIMTVWPQAKAKVAGTQLRNGRSKCGTRCRAPLPIYETGRKSASACRAFLWRPTADRRVLHSCLVLRSAPVRGSRFPRVPEGAACRIGALSRAAEKTSRSRNSKWIRRPDRCTHEWRHPFTNDGGMVNLAPFRICTWHPSIIHDRLT